MLEDPWYLHEQGDVAPSAEFFINHYRVDTEVCSFWIMTAHRIMSKFRALAAGAADVGDDFAALNFASVLYKEKG